MLVTNSMILVMLLALFTPYVILNRVFYVYDFIPLLRSVALMAWCIVLCAYLFDFYIIDEDGDELSVFVYLLIMVMFYTAAVWHKLIPESASSWQKDIGVFIGVLPVLIMCSLGGLFLVSAPLLMVYFAIPNIFSASLAALFFFLVALVIMSLVSFATYMDFFHDLIKQFFVNLINNKKKDK